MEWTTIGFYSFNFLASIGAYLFLSGTSDVDVGTQSSFSQEIDFSLPTFRLRSIAQFVVSNDLYYAQYTWDETLTDLSLDQTQMHRSLSYIISHVESILVQEPELTCPNRIFVTLLKFIQHFTTQVSFSIHHKAKFHARVLQMLESISSSSKKANNPYNHLEGVYAVTKSATDQRLEHVYFPVTSNSTEHSNLNQMIPLSFWLLASQGNILVQNVKYKSYLYVGRERPGSSLQLFLWNQHLTNRNQAAFRLLSRNEAKPCEEEFLNFVMFQPQMNRLMMTQCCLKNESQEQQTENILLARPYPEKDPNICEVRWKVQFIDSNGHFRLITRSKCLSGILSAVSPHAKTARSNIQLVNQSNNDQLSDDSTWKLVAYR